MAKRNIKVHEATPPPPVSLCPNRILPKKVASCLSASYPVGFLSEYHFSEWHEEIILARSVALSPITPRCLRYIR